MKKIFVSGCFDMLHSGHVAFLEEAALHGDVYVGLGSDRTVYELKGRATINPEDERLYMIRSLKAVKHAWINTGSGILDFLEDFERVGPDALFVNEDGHSPDKESFCRNRNIAYIISKRVPKQGLPGRSTTALRREARIPYRIDLAGGWLDQPYVSIYHPGPVITISIEPDYEFNDRSGMSTSTRKKAIELWPVQIPDGDYEKYAKILFSYENPPGSDYVSGSQDAIGIVFPGANCLHYMPGKYWPSKTESIRDPQLLQWLEDRIYLLALKPRESGFNVTDEVDINTPKAAELARAATLLWESLLHKDAAAFGQAMTDSFKAQTAMFPNMTNPMIEKVISSLPESVLGYKLSGAGGGGYLVLFSETAVADTLRIRIRN